VEPGSLSLRDIDGACDKPVAARDKTSFGKIQSMGKFPKSHGPLGIVHFKSDKILRCLPFESLALSFTIHFGISLDQCPHLQELTMFNVSVRVCLVDPPEKLG
jgi:hypothetical protein